MMKNQGFLQKCCKFHYAVSFLFLNRFLWFLMFFKVQNRVFPFFASGYSINLLQWTKKSWLSAARSQTILKFCFLKFSFFEIWNFRNFHFSKILFPFMQMLCHRDRSEAADELEVLRISWVSVLLWDSLDGTTPVVGKSYRIKRKCTQEL